MFDHVLTFMNLIWYKITKSRGYDDISFKTASYNLIYENKGLR